MDKPNESDALFGTTWVHVFEEDTSAGAVYRPEDSDIPLSRRPRERLSLDRDGSARVFMAGPDDRFVERQADWVLDGDVIVIRVRGEDTQRRIVERSPQRLVIQRRTAAAG